MAETFYTATTIAIQLVLAAIGVWYTLETQRLRRQSEAQLILLRQQADTDRFPFIVPSSTLFVKDGKGEAKLAGHNHPAPKPSGGHLPGEDYLAYVVAHNYTPALAQDVRCVLYDANVRKFFRAARSLSIVGGKDHGDFYISKTPHNRQEIVDFMQERYAGAASVFESPLQAGGDSYAMLSYLDIDGRPHWVKRTHERRGDDLVMLYLTSSRLREKRTASGSA